MSNKQTRNLILQSWKSSELEGMLDMIFQSSLDHEIRYTQKIEREFHQIIVAQSYGQPIYEMLHFLKSLSQEGHDWPGVIWSIPQATSSQFRKVLRAEKDLVVAQYGTDQFAIHFARMPILSALTEFMVSVAGYQVVKDAVDAINGLSDAQNHANHLSRILYQFLKDHLPTQQIQRKFLILVEFLEERYGANFQPDAITDQDIFDFWGLNASSINDGQDMHFRQYETVLKDFLRLRQAVDEGDGRYQENYAVTIGHRFEDGEREIADDAAWYRTYFAEENMVMQFFEAPLSFVKFLNNRESDALNLIIEASKYSQNWPLSIMRCFVFGKEQRRIIQALRQKASVDEIFHLCGLHDALDYYECRMEYDKLSDQLNHKYQASLYAVMRDQMMERLSLQAEGIQVLHPEKAVDQMVEDAMKSINDEQASNMGALVKSYKAINRKGFELYPEGDPQRMEAFRKGCDLLPMLNQRLCRWLSAFDCLLNKQQTIQQLYERDQTLFAQHLKDLYGKANS